MARREQMSIGILTNVGINKKVGTMIVKVHSEDSAGKVMLCSASGAPTGAIAGYAVGCIYIRTSNGAIYYNTGSVTSTTWTLQGTVSALSVDNSHISATAGIVNTKLAVPRIGVISQAIVANDFTDGGGTSGYLDLTAKLPAGAIPVGFYANVATGFTEDTSAGLTVGKAGATDMFSIASVSVLAAALVGGAPVKAATNVFCAAETTVRLTVTGASDFTLLKNGAGAMTFKMFYIDSITA